jgi:outer membrane beta-barrel protein
MKLQQMQLRRSIVLALLALIIAPPGGSAADVDPNAYGPHITRKKMVELDHSDRNVVRAGPGPNFALVQVLGKGKQLSVIAKSGEWYNVHLSESETGWIHSSLCREFYDMSDLEFRPNPKLFSRVGSFALTAVGGAYSFDRKSNSMMAGGRLSYFVFEHLSVEGSAGWTRVVRPAEIVESLFQLELAQEDFHMVFYSMDLNLKLAPGRQVVPYVTMGLGSTIMQGETESSINYGAGTWMYLSRRTALRWEFRNHRFDSGLGSARRSNSNLEFSMGTSFLF